MIPRINSVPTTTASALRNDRFDIEQTLLAGALRVEPTLKDERRGLLIDHLSAARARDVCFDQHALGLRRGEALVLFVAPNPAPDRGSERRDQLLDPACTMADPP